VLAPERTRNGEVDLISDMLPRASDDPQGNTSVTFRNGHKWDSLRLIDKESPL